MTGPEAADAGQPAEREKFLVCEQCPTCEACEIAEFCVIESRFGRTDLSIGELTCRSCGRSSESSWACTKGGDCDASSQLWGEWFLVRLYANDARTGAAAAIDQEAAELASEDDWEPCQHDCTEDCYDDFDEHHCRHQHCFACGGCGCPGYCDDYQTYNLRPAETGGAG